MSNTPDQAPTTIADLLIQLLELLFGIKINKEKDQDKMDKILAVAELLQGTVDRQVAEKTAAQTKEIAALRAEVAQLKGQAAPQAVTPVKQEAPVAKVTTSAGKVKMDKRTIRRKAMKKVRARKVAAAKERRAQGVGRSRVKFLGNAGLRTTEIAAAAPVAVPVHTLSIGGKLLTLLGAGIMATGMGVDSLASKAKPFSNDLMSGNLRRRGVRHLGKMGRKGVVKMQAAMHRMAVGIQRRARLSSRKMRERMGLVRALPKATAHMALVSAAVGVGSLQEKLVKMDERLIKGPQMPKAAVRPEKDGTTEPSI